MVTDIITLKLVYVYLDRFQSNQGKVTSINLAIRSNHSDVTKSIVFQDLEHLKTEINKYNGVSLTNLECYDLHLYELKSFNVEIELNGLKSTKNVIQYNGSIYQSDSLNVNSANMQIINGSYLETLKDIQGFWGDIKLDEYIKEQKKYIDCGYIKVFFEETIEVLEKLYKKYKNM